MTRQTLPNDWTADPRQIQRARIHLAIWLAKQPQGELVRMIMEWLGDTELQRFCRRYLDNPDLARIDPSATAPVRPSDTPG